jgi:hypothetical protein
MPTLQKRFLLCTLLCGLVAGLLLWPGRGGGFMLDDEPFVSENAAVHISTLDAGSLMQAAYSFAPGGGSRALPMVTFALDYWRGGGDPKAFKTTNIVIHILTVLALAGFFNLLLSMAGWPQRKTAWAAPVLALAWAIHPLQVSSVLYVVQRMQTLATLFVVLALWAYLFARRAQIENRPSRQHWITTGLFWVLALASKEDAILLPAYALALELTVLQFKAARPELARTIRKTWLGLVAFGIVSFLAFMVPHYWQSDAYPFRNFSTYERLLTQGRVLSMYVGQVLFPLPGRLPFFYDGFVPSRGLLEPATTLPGILFVIGLLALAWCLRERRPLFAFGVFIFFAGHFISSNVIGLELAFEHRNHLPLIGAVLAIADLLAAALNYHRHRPRLTFVFFALMLTSLGTATSQRVQTWSTPLKFAQTSVTLAPDSERAWIALCRSDFDMSAGKPESPYFDAAIKACTQGAEIPDGASTLASLVVLKTIKGNVGQQDWGRLLERMQHVTMTPSNVAVARYLASYSNTDEQVDVHNVVRVIDIVAKRAGFTPQEYAGFAYYMSTKHSLEPDSYRYFTLAVEKSPPDSPLIRSIFADLRSDGKENWAIKLEELANRKSSVSHN